MDHIGGTEPAGEQPNTRGKVKTRRSRRPILRKKPATTRHTASYPWSCRPPLTSHMWSQSDARIVRTDKQCPGQKMRHKTGHAAKNKRMHTFARKDSGVSFDWNAYKLKGIECYANVELQR